ncbi:galactose oxidase [Schaalia sp. 19OD2882]|uniref:fibrinogen-like YCDxxxxGGGW domain-containing protein n=1 Tax=Schaalia sp. 19OD2882 TaxID=2794089 RepID=UPI001C1ED0B3|nr:fibrinogen-like YCDxxxxGGGW domain-containing protein [Schaalia sp. 19OD2882]QWW19170.1 galactose oxidase [Schaalia sp. 19OD2882]
MSIRRALAGFGAAVLVALASVVNIQSVALADQARDGSSAQAAAASCWEIKQNRPDAPDGTYWLLTPQMDAPAQFFCDQSTDGGGWVLIGRGREYWESYSRGQGDTASLRTRERSPKAFAAAQYSEKTVNELIGGTPVKDLEDGVRILRATDENGRSWQKVDIAFTHLNAFEWFFHTYTDGRIRFDGGSWQQAPHFVSRVGDTGVAGLDISMYSNKEYRTGFAFGPAVKAGSTSANSYIWRQNSGALPYSEVYVRPRLTSTEGFQRIDDSGTGEKLVPATVSDLAAATPWGVVGNLNGRTSEGNSLAQAFVQIGQTMYVGGNFTGVQRGSGAAPIARTGVAAFDVASGELRPDFAVTVDGQVKALAALPDGRLLVGGEFRTVNGSAHAGTVVLDPTTGAVDESWDLQVLNRLKSAKGSVSVRALDVDGDRIYIGGYFTHLQRPGKAQVYARSAGRVGLDGTPDRSWNPEFNGSLMDLDATGEKDRFYAAGYFTTSGGGRFEANKATVLRTAPGAEPATDFRFVGSTDTRRNYQQTVIDSGPRAYIGGSEHSLFGYDPTSMERLSGVITTTLGGDLQTTTTDGVTVYGGCHCFSRAYDGAYRWSDPGRTWTRSVRVQGVFAVDAATGAIHEWTPYLLRGKGSGAWGSGMSNDGTLWLGGDFTASRTVSGRNQWNSGFVRYPARDRVAPATPGGLKAALSSDKSTVALSWSGVEGASTYQVLRDDRVVASTRSASVKVPAGGENRYFVRAVDSEGNISASSPVAVPGKDSAPAPKPAPKPDPRPEPNPSPKPAPEPKDGALIGEDAQWSYLYQAEDPGAKWFAPDADLSTWKTGQAPLGYGDSDLRTVLTPPDASRPVTAYFRTQFTVEDPAALGDLVLKYVADDGAVVRINGVEVSRTRMAPGAVGHWTRAHEAISTHNAVSEPTVVHVPAEVLVKGVNHVSVDTHVNWSRSRSLTFRATLADEGR